MMMLTQVSPQTERNWSEKEYVGMRNLQIKLWKMVSQVKIDITAQQNHSVNSFLAC